MAQSRFTDLKGPLSQALGRIAALGPGSALLPVWADAVGPLLAARSEPVRFADGSLTVEVEREFLEELRLETQTVASRMNDRLGRQSVRRIVWVERPRNR